MESTEIDDLTNDFNIICEDIANIKNIIGELTTKLKNYKKKVDKIVKENEKSDKKDKSKTKKDKDVEEVKEVKEPKEKKEPKKKEKKNKGGDIKPPPSGISSAALLSDELCEFLEKPVGTKLFRAEVTKLLYKYINDNHLQDIENKKIIRVDDKMKKLLGLEDNQELTYFNIQTFMNKHYCNNPDSSNLEEDKDNE
jgi:chromatin remodeling complex protein RSC6